LSKSEIRNRIRELRRKQDSSSIIKKSGAIWKFLLSLPEYRKARTIALYASITKEGEVATADIIEGSLAQNKKVYLPKVVSDHLEFFNVKSIEELKEGAFGILEPTGDKVKAEQIDLIVLPGIAFDVFGNRLGFGRGYYDRFLKKVRNASMVALAFDFQIVNRIPSTKSDVRIHKIVTESRIINCKG
jgi:5-formyltetrahydrofolate cyclo-ligase